MNRFVLLYFIAFYWSRCSSHACLWKVTSVQLIPPPCIGKPPAVLKHAFDLWSCLSDSALRQFYHSEILLLALLSFLAKSVSTVWSVKAAKQFNCCSFSWKWLCAIAGFFAFLNGNNFHQHLSFNISPLLSEGNHLSRTKAIALWLLHCKELLGSGGYLSSAGEGSAPGEWC